MMKIRIIGLAITALMLAVAFVAPAGAQGTDFGAVSTSLQQLSNQLDNALAQPDDATMQAVAAQALGAAETLGSDLKAIEASATDDATRSRASGLAAHVDAAIGSLTSAQTATGDQLRSQINAAKAEINEAMAEVPQTGGGAQQPQQVPQTGQPGLVTSYFGVLALVGVLFLLAGLALRKLQLAQR